MDGTCPGQCPGHVQDIEIFLGHCPVPALCIGTHNHPPPPPERTPAGIKDELQTMIQNIIASDDSVISRSIIAGDFF